MGIGLWKGITEEGPSQVWDAVHCILFFATVSVEPGPPSGPQANAWPHLS